jgi:UDP-N-acetylglucosamine/UDP-N-acetylgalactosamine diphosphorylase
MPTLVAASLSQKNRYQAALNTLKTVQQEHLLHFYHQLSPEEQDHLLTQIESQDWSNLNRLIDTYVHKEPKLNNYQSIAPAPYYPVNPSIELAETYQEARALGETMLKNGKVAAFTVAGGQGTRLGWNGPKGIFAATPSGKSLFQVFAESILKTQQKYRTTIPWYIMTSPINHQDTLNFFVQNDYFGLESQNLMLFPQGLLPSIGLDGKVLLNTKSDIAMNPDGHGGSLIALKRSGALTDMKQRGIEQISYFQVDNPNVKALDPLFIGLHAQSHSEMSSKMLAKRSAKEKVGNFCLLDGKVGIIEYSDMPDELATSLDGEGQLRFRAGSIAIHMISRRFVERLTAGNDAKLIYHKAIKAVPFVDESGQIVKPEKPNAVKLERFIFDALPLANKSIILETDRIEEFAPIKNATGEDSPDSSKALQTERAARWLAEHGVSVPRDNTGQVEAVIEISPLTAIESRDLASVTLPKQIQRSQKLTL